MQTANADTLALTVWRRIQPQLERILSLLSRKKRYTYYSIDELRGEMHYIFFKHFYEHWQDDQQFLAFMYVSLKNRMIDLQRQNIKYYQNHINLNNLPSYSNNEEAGDSDKLNSVASEYNVIEHVNYREALKRIHWQLPDALHRDVFWMLMEGFSNLDIKEKLGISQVKINSIKNNYLKPTLKRVLKIKKRRYAMLCDNGRIPS